MSRNSRRTQAPSSPVQPQRPQIPQAGSNPFGISFVIPTEDVQLPSGGRFYSEGSTMFGRSSLEIKQMTAKEEEILSNVKYLEDGTMIDRLLASVLIDKTVNVADIMSSDKNAIIISARLASYGADYEVTRLCEGCNTEQKFVYDLSKSTIKNEIPEDVHVDETTGYCTFDLPQTELEIVTKILGPEDEIYLQEQKKKAQKLGLDNSDTINFLRRVVISVNNVTDPKLLGQLFEVLPVLDLRKIKKVNNEVLPSLNTTQEITCGSCGHVTESEVPFSLGFFWPEL